jgi:hypothetical protein
MTARVAITPSFRGRRAAAGGGARVGLVAAYFAVAGCSGRPSAVRPPDIEPDRLARAAIEQYDTNGDATLDSKELASAPSLRFSANRIDTNNDGKIVADEIAQFMKRYWIDTAAGIIRIRCAVNYSGRPLDGATVTFEPETFMHGAVKPASGVTRGGMAVISVSDADRPDPNARGVQNGLYLVRVSKVVNGKETIPEKYNKHTILGCEVADRASYMPGPVTFNL